MTMRRFLVLLLGGSILAGAAGFAAGAAELRRFTTLHSGEVRIADLFDGADNPQRVLGPGPAPGSQIVVEAPQLAAIARQFGVDWRPASGADSAVLERPGHALARDAVMDGLRQALAGAGVSDDAEVTLPGWNPPMVPETGVHAQIGDLDYDAASGRFNASLMITGDGMAPIRARIGGEVHEMMTVPVVTRRIMPGDVIGPADLRMGRVRGNDINGDFIHVAAGAFGLAPRRPLMPGQKLRVADLVRPPLVLRGAIVSIALEGPGMSLSAQGQALDQGALGEHVRVLNPASRAVLDAEITGPGSVRVLPGSTPLSTTTRFNQVANR